MEKLYCLLKPFVNIYTIIIAWILAFLNLYICFKPMLDYTASAGLDARPTVLDGMAYYTPNEGYQSLTNLGPAGRDAYRWTNYADFVLPVVFFAALSLSNMALGKGSGYILSPFLYMAFDYVENIAEKSVLEIYPRRSDAVMTVACYAGLAKLLFFGVSLLTVAVNGTQRIFGANPAKKKAK